MARKNPDKAKEAFKKLSSEILKFGDEGKADLKELFDLHRPEVIFKLEPGPERQARAAQLISEMRILARELAHAKYFRSREKLKAEKQRKGKGKPRARRQLSGVHDGFKYILVELPDGQWGAKITRQARQIIPDREAPPIVDHPRLAKPFEDQASAELAVRRIINTSMIWYSERGIIPKEKVRTTKSGRAGAQRRTAGQVAARQREQTERRESASAKRERERRAEERRTKKAKRQKPRRPEAASSRKVVYIPRKNPSTPFAFSHSESSALKQAKKSFEKYKEWEERWNESLEAKRPDFNAVMKAYDHVENARANFTLAEERHLADKADEVKRSLRHNIIEMFKVCNRELRSRRDNPKGNPSKSAHEKIGQSHMKKAETAWAKYCDSSCESLADLLNAYKHLEIAREEFQHAGAAEGVRQAKEKISIARADLRKMCKD